MCNMNCTDPRGPFRTVLSVEQTPQANLTRFEECDHVAQLVSHFAPAKPGEQVRCFHCGPAAAKELIENTLVEMIEDYECATTNALARNLALKAEVPSLNIERLREILLGMARKGKIYLASRGWDMSLAWMALEHVDSAEFGKARDRYEDDEPWYMSPAERADYMTGLVY